MGIGFFSLRYKIISSVVLIKTVMLSIMVWSNVSQVRQIHQDRLEQSVQMVLQQFTATAGRYLFEVDHTSLEEYAANILAHDELTYLIIEDANRISTLVRPCYGSGPFAQETCLVSPYD